MHHWRGAAFVPGAKPQDMLALLRDYDRLLRDYSPEVESSRALEQHAEFATVAMRMKKQKVVTVVLDGQYDVQTRMTAANRGYSISRSQHIWEVEWPGTTHERHMKEGDDDGFLWRLNSYWSFVELPDGLLIECEAVSLTRDIPSGLGWLAAPILEQLPRESLEFTLKATRNALTARCRERNASMSSLCEVQVRESKIADRRQSGFVKALRVHQSLTADVEKLALMWMAIRTPAFINSDHLTALGLSRKFWQAWPMHLHLATGVHYGW